LRSNQWQFSVLEVSRRFAGTSMSSGISINDLSFPFQDGFNFLKKLIHIDFVDIDHA
jgi:hypothetical protein